MRKVTSPSARTSLPIAPSKFSVTALLVPVFTARLLAEKSTTWSPGLDAWFSSTLRFLTVGNRSDKPTMPTLAALAVNAVHLRAGVETELIMARPKSIFSSFRPISSAVPPFTPANTLMPEPPMVNTFALIVSAVELLGFLARVTSSVVLLTARLPETCTKP